MKNLDVERPNSYANIPEELRLLSQWTCWKGDKVPYQPNGKLLHVDDPNTWSSFDACAATGLGIGFIFSVDDPYCFIDLDDTEGDKIALERQIKISNEFNSYSEISPSGNGLHIICKGSVPQGRRRSFIEVYSSGRYATMTGNVYKDVPIRDCQELLTRLYDQMGGAPNQNLVYIGDKDEKFTDDEIIVQMRSAANADKFNTLFAGDWSTNYPSQSEADLALVNIIAFYTQNRNQITRIFRLSKLGVRDKAKRKDYLLWMINKAFDRIVPSVDLDGFKIALESKVAKSIAHNSTAPELPTSSIQLPPGLLGELAQFIYAAAPRPVPEIALAAAIGLMAGICGRAYNISGTGLNQYVLVLAKTGSGKEAAASGIDRLMNAIKFQVPTSIDFRGPGIINSGQALAKYLGNASKCFVSVLGEFGIRLETMSSRDANSAEKTLLSMLFDLYNKSGFGQTLQPNIYSAKEDSIGIIESPAFSILGESTPGRFYNCLNEQMISDGLLPRFLLIEYKGKRPEYNETHMNMQPSMMLVDKLESLVANASQLAFQQPRRVINVDQSGEALSLTRAFNIKADKYINSTDNDVIAELWNRAHMKVLKLAALIAVGVDYLNPIIQADHVLWATSIIENDIKALSTKFDLGEIGKQDDESKQLKDIVKHIKEYVTDPWDRIKPYCPSFKELHQVKVIPYDYFSSRTSRLSSYRLDKGGATNALKRTIQILIDSGKMIEVTKSPEFIKQFGTGRRAFFPNERVFE